jgi:transposase
MRTKGTAAELEMRRRIAGRLLLQGKKLQEVADAVAASMSSVKRWKKAVQEGGLDALAAKPQPGREPKLDEEQKAQLVETLLEGPIEAGYRTALWTCGRVAEVIQKRFHVNYHPCHVWKILRGLGWSCQKPEQKAREQDEKEVRRWRAVEWPRIKRGHGKTS